MIPPGSTCACSSVTKTCPWRSSLQGVTIFLVEFLLDPTAGVEAGEAIELARKELDFYLVELNEPDPWEYAIYHCGTSANVYSQIHWGYYVPEAEESGEDSTVIPDGLSRCSVCNELKGELLLEEDTGPQRAPVRCLCDGLICGKCGRERIHRPTSNYYDEKLQHLWHVPYFTAMLRRCSRCGAQNWLETSAVVVSRFPPTGRSG